jgi:hypothetical protein
VGVFGRVAGVSRRGVHGVVPVRVEFVAVELAGFEVPDLLVADLDALFVGTEVEFGVDRQPGRCCCGPDGLDDDLVGGQGSGAPAAADRGEQPGE